MRSVKFLCAAMNSISESEANDRASLGLLRKRELAEKLAISKRTLDVWMNKGRIPFLKVGRSVRFRLPDVLEKLSTFRVN
jgi:excisionase family DNA binding protein